MLKFFKKGLAALIIVMVSGQIFPVLAADSFVLNMPDKNEFEVDEIVGLTGQNLEQFQDSGYICFNDLNTCFDSNDELVQEWSDNFISFKMPYASNVKQKGNIFVVGRGQVLLQFPYNFKPYIEGYVQNGKVVSEGFPGESLRIQGMYFGQNKGTVKFGILDGNVTSWSDSVINVTVPTPTNTDTKTIDICTSANVCQGDDFTVGRQIFDDPMSAEQTYLKSINYDQAYSLLVPKTPVIVAVLDDGVDTSHPELEGKIWVNTKEIPGDGLDNDDNGYVDDVNGYNFLNKNGVVTPKNTHGTSVAGIIAAARNNGIGIAGIAPNVQIMPVVICGQDNTCNERAIIDSIKYAVDNGARVINLSLAATAVSGYSDEFDDVIKYAFDHNVLVVVAAGNGDVDSNVGRDLTKNPESPICNDNDENMVLGVGASDETNAKHTVWSNYGNCVDIYAPGENVTTLSSSADLYTTVDGTSFSTPIISAVAAQILETYPDMKNSTLISYMVKDGPYLDTLKLFNDIKSTYHGETSTPPTAVTVSEPTSGEPGKIASSSGFSDVLTGNLNFNAITYLRQNNIIAGFTDGTFKPEQAVTRAEMLKILIGAIGVNPGDQYKQSCFHDVKASDWYAPYVCYAKAKGWAQGYADGTFRPNNTINKVEAIKFLAVINSLKPGNVAFLPYADVDESAWYDTYLKEAYGLGLLEENNNSYEPTAPMTRGSIAESIFRLLLVKKFGATTYTGDLVNKL